jgi:hypothetical protein
MADDGLPSGYKYASPTAAAPASTPQATAPAAPTGLPSGYKPPAAPASTQNQQPPPPPVTPPPPPPANSAAQDDGGWLHWLATKGLGQDYQRSIEKGMTLGLGDAITGGIMGTGKAAVTGDTSAISDEIARQRADTAAARERIGPVGQAATDVVSQFMPAQRLLGSAPYVGSILQGGVQDATNAYGEGKSWSDIMNAGLTGGATGAAASTLTNPTVLHSLLKYGPPAAVVGGAGHAFLPEFHGGWAGAVLSPFVGNERLDKVTDWAADKAASLVSNPAARQALQNLIIGGSSSARDTATGKTVTQNLTNALPSVNSDTAGTALQNLRGMLPF